MILCANMTNLPGDLNRFEGREDFARFCRQHGLDGVELLPLGGDALGWLPPQAVMGVHLTFQPSWLDFWRGDEAAVAAEFGSLEAAYGVFGGRSPQALPLALRRDLGLAQRIGARYAVCHVSNVTLEECVTYRFTHSDEAVCQGAAEVISQALEGLDLSLDFLVLNCQVKCNSVLKKTSKGDFQPRHLRGRRLSLAMKDAICPSPKFSISTDLGQYSRIRPFVFSFVPRSHGAWGFGK